jgi:hypothetical protein
LSGGLRCLFLLHFGSMMSDDAPGGGARYGMMTRDMACHGPDRGAFDATVCIADHGKHCGGEGNPQELFAHH